MSDVSEDEKKLRKELEDAITNGDTTAAAKVAEKLAQLKKAPSKTASFSSTNAPPINGSLMGSLRAKKESNSFNNSVAKTAESPTTPPLNLMTTVKLTPTKNSSNSTSNLNSTASKSAINPVNNAAKPKLTPKPVSTIPATKNSQTNLMKSVGTPKLPPKPSRPNFVSQDEIVVSENSTENSHSSVLELHEVSNTPPVTVVSQKSRAETANANIITALKKEGDRSKELDRNKSPARGRPRSKSMNEEMESIKENNNDKEKEKEREKRSKSPGRFLKKTKEDEIKPGDKNSGFLSTLRGKSNVKEKPNDKKDNSDYNFRLKSFTSEYPHSRPSPEDLAFAGFFYYPAEGKKDQAKCYSCGIKIYNWLPSDDPKLEHEKFGKSCKEVQSWQPQSSPVETPKSDPVRAKSPAPAREAPLNQSRRMASKSALKSAVIKNRRKTRKEVQDEIERLKKLGMTQQYEGLKPGQETMEQRLERVKEKIKHQQNAVYGLERLMAFYASDLESMSKTEDELNGEKGVLESLKHEHEILEAIVGKQKEGSSIEYEWIEYKTEDGYAYYYNVQTGITSWDQPPEFISAESLTKE